MSNDQISNDTSVSTLIPETMEEQKKASELIEKFEGFAIRNAKSGLDLNNLTERQVDKVLDIMQQNENNAFNYHCKRLDTVEKINLSEISTKSSHHRTLRIFFIIASISIVLVTILILYSKDQFFIPWMTFLGGNLSGIGASRIPKLLTGEPSKPRIPKEEDKDKD